MRHLANCAKNFVIIFSLKFKLGILKVLIDVTYDNTFKKGGSTNKLMNEY